MLGMIYLNKNIVCGMKINEMEMKERKKKKKRRREEETARRK